MQLGKVGAKDMTEVKGGVFGGELDKNTLDTCMKFSINKKNSLSLGMNDIVSVSFYAKCKTWKTLWRYTGGCLGLAHT